MSRFSGSYFRGAARVERAAKKKEAEVRQKDHNARMKLLHDLVPELDENVTALQPLLGVVEALPVAEVEEPTTKKRRVRRKKVEGN